MKTQIRLTDFGTMEEILSLYKEVVPTTRRYTLDLVREAITALNKKGLAYNNINGDIILDRGIVERYSNSNDFTKHTSLEDIFRWEFARYINNACSRKARGYEYV